MRSRKRGGLRTMSEYAARFLNCACIGFLDCPCKREAYSESFFLISRLKTMLRDDIPGIEIERANEQISRLHGTILDRDRRIFLGKAEKIVRSLARLGCNAHPCSCEICPEVISAVHRIRALVEESHEKNHYE